MGKLKDAAISHGFHFDCTLIPKPTPTTKSSKFFFCHFEPNLPFSQALFYDTVLRYICLLLLLACMACMREQASYCWFEQTVLCLLLFFCFLFVLANYSFVFVSFFCVLLVFATYSFVFAGHGFAPWIIFLHLKARTYLVNWIIYRTYIPTETQ